MSSVVRDTVHVISTDFEYAKEDITADRLGYILGRTAASKVYILKNGNRLSADKGIEDDAETGVKEIVKEKTKAADKGGIHVIETDFYNFDTALADVYEILYREKRESNDISVNISGGTKPLAIAVSFACALMDLDEPPFYIPKNYSRNDEGIHTSGIDSNAKIVPLDPIDISGMFPSNEEEKKLLRFLYQSEYEEIGVTDLLEEVGEFENSDSRRTIQNTYYDRRDKLADRGLLNYDGDEISFTPSGDLIARLLDIQDKID